MSAGPAAALAVLLGFAAAWELAGSRGEEVADSVRGAVATLSRGRVRSLTGAALRLRVPGRLERAGLAGRVPAVAVLAAKGAVAALGAMLGLAAAPAAPGRLAAVVVLALPAAGFMAPDALLEREARRRRARLVAAMPDVLDLLAVGAGAGRAPVRVLGEIARGTSGPLAAELAATVAEIECGASEATALAALRHRVPGAELGALATALERSRRYGSPLAEQLHAQAQTLRGEARRRIEERAARAAPKIQLVVALILVPSVLLMILAALVAHADALLAGFAA